MNTLSTTLLVVLCFVASSCHAQTEAPVTAVAQQDVKPSEGTTSKTIPNDLDAKLLSDLTRTDYLEVAKEWSKLYDRLDTRFKDTVHTGDSEYKMDYGDLYGLNKGFSWVLCGNYADNELGDTIVNEFGATGGSSETDEANGYRAGMVYFYVKYHLLKCE